MNLGERLKQVRTERGLSYRKAAQGIGISVSTLHDIEHGSDTHLSTAVAIAHFYGLELKVLVEPAK